MSTHDANGKPYARLSSLRPGDKLICDDGFACLPADKVCLVWGATNAGGLYINCKDGRHYLDGQLGDDSDALIGLYRCEPLA